MTELAESLAMARTRIARYVWLAAALAGPFGCAHARPRPEPVARAAASTDSRPVVWVADGAGGLFGCSTSLAAAVAADGDPVELTPFVWTHGYRRILLDQIDTTHARDQGRRLAATIAGQRARDPTRRVVVVGHSAGAAVALAAAECLPAGAIDRLVLLAPSVSADYDLGPAAAAAREGIDVFCSRKDVWALGVAMRLVGTTDGGRAPAAGRKGFRVSAGTVRQHFWSPDWRPTGHTGGHYGVYAPGFAKAYLIPLMVGNGPETIRGATPGPRVGETPVTRR